MPREVRVSSWQVHRIPWMILYLRTLSSLIREPRLSVITILFRMLMALPGARLGLSLRVSKTRLGLAKQMVRARKVVSLVAVTRSIRQRIAVLARDVVVLPMVHARLTKRIVAVVQATRLRIAALALVSVVIPI